MTTHRTCICVTCVVFMVCSIGITLGCDVLYAWCTKCTSSSESTVGLGNERCYQFRPLGNEYSTHLGGLTIYDCLMKLASHNRIDKSDVDCSFNITESDSAVFSHYGRVINLIRFISPDIDMWCSWLLLMATPNVQYYNELFLLTIIMDSIFLVSRYTHKRSGFHGGCIVYDE